MSEDRDRLDARHDPRASKVERHARQLHRVAGEELVEIVLDDLGAPHRLVIDHAVEVFEVESAPVHEQFAWPDEVDRVFRLELAEHGSDGLCKGLGLTRHGRHGNSPLAIGGTPKNMAALHATTGGKQTRTPDNRPLGVSTHRYGSPGGQFCKTVVENAPRWRKRRDSPNREGFRAKAAFGARESARREKVRELSGSKRRRFGQKKPELGRARGCE